MTANLFWLDIQTITGIWTSKRFGFQHRSPNRNKIPNALQTRPEQFFEFSGPPPIEPTSSNSEKRGSKFDVPKNRIFEYLLLAVCLRSRLSKWSPNQTKIQLKTRQLWNMCLYEFTINCQRPLNKSIHRRNETLLHKSDRTLTNKLSKGCHSKLLQ